MDEPTGLFQMSGYRDTETIKVKGKCKVLREQPSQWPQYSLKSGSVGKQVGRVDLMKATCLFFLT